jgi:hypothetical protein
MTGFMTLSNIRVVVDAAAEAADAHPGARPPRRVASSAQTISPVSVSIRRAFIAATNFFLPTPRRRSRGRVDRLRVAVLGHRAGEQVVDAEQLADLRTAVAGRRRRRA